MNKNRIRLTESQLHRVIKESVKKVLRENVESEQRIKDYVIGFANIISKRLLSKTATSSNEQIQDVAERIQRAAQSVGTEIPLQHIIKILNRMYSEQEFDTERKGVGYDMGELY